MGHSILACVKREVNGVNEREREGFRGLGRGERVKGLVG